MGALSTLLIADRCGRAETVEWLIHNLGVAIVRMSMGYG